MQPVAAQDCSKILICIKKNQHDKMPRKFVGWKPYELKIYAGVMLHCGGRTPFFAKAANKAISTQLQTYSLLPLENKQPTALKY